MDDDTTPERLRHALATLTQTCQDDEVFRAAWLGGSLARGVADDWSDIDLHVLVHEPESFRAREWFASQVTVVLADEIPGVAGGFLFVTPEWMHVDLIVHGVKEFEQGPFPARILFDRGLVQEIPPEHEATAGEPYEPDASARLFIYFMGNLVTVAYREEWIGLAQGTAMMRDSFLVPLMLAENGVRKKDGAKRLNRYLTAEQIRTLQSIPAVGTDPEQLLAAQEAIAREYLVRGRRLAARVGTEWPTVLEHAARALWSRELGIRLG